MSDFGYEFTPTDDGFTVSAPCDRTPVRVTLNRWQWTVAELDGQIAPQSIGLIRTKYLSDRIAERLRQGWKPRDGGMPSKRLYDWAVGRTAQAIHKRVQAEATRLLADVPKEVLDVQRAVFAATFGTGEAARPELYEPQYVLLRHDIKQYRAAAAALREVHNLVRDSGERKVRNSPEYKALEVRASEFGMEVTVYPKPVQPRANGERPSRHRIFDRLADDWMGMFSPDGHPYRSLRRTLMNLPGGVPPGLLTSLPSIPLPRPIIDRVELLTLLSAHQQARGRPSLSNKSGIFVHATRPQIVKAMGMVADTIHQPLSSRRTKDIGRFVAYITDYPGEHHGTIVGLARRSIRWHREQREQEIADTAERLGNHPAVAPPIPPPEGVEFLGDVHRIAEEGQRMSHCVGAYAQAAINGYSYLFHVTYRGEDATVEVSPFGHVTQAQGPSNSDNSACRYGRRVLNRWGQGFPNCDPTQIADPWAIPAHEPQPF